MRIARIPPQMAKQDLALRRDAIEEPPYNGPDTPTQVGQQMPTVQGSPNPAAGTEWAKVEYRGPTTASAETQAAAGFDNGRKLAADTMGTQTLPPGTTGQEFAARYVEGKMPPETLERARRASQFFQGVAGGMA